MSLETPTPAIRRANPASSDDHPRKVERIARAVREAPQGRALSFRKRAVSHQVPKRHDPARGDWPIDVADLDAILEIDREAMTCTAEPGVTFADLLEVTLPLGLAPAVVPELKTITVGGAVAGCSLESMSFRVGGFHDTCVELEVLTASGEVLRCTRENEHALLFEMLHGTFGTLGLITRLVFRLIEARPFVHLEYERYATLGAFKNAIQRRFLAQDVDFMDGIIHAKDLYVLSLGRFAERAPYTHRYDWTRVYYASTARRREDWLETRQYYFRYDHGVTRVHPRSWLGRLLFGRFVSSAQVLALAQRLHRFLPDARPDVTVDLFIPFSRVDAFMRWYQAKLDFFPLWCVPYKRVRDYPWISPRLFEGVDDALFLDLAIYGMKQPPGRNVYRELEEALAEVHGIKTLISHNFYDRETFWSIWDESSYRAAKQRTDPENRFRDLYEKTCGVHSVRAAGAP